jgi:diguanylate cyclase (GGDEF)-like protein
MRQTKTIAMLAKTGLEAENATLRAALAALQARVDELALLADTDTLVPLPNRRAFMRELGRVIHGVTRYGHQAAVLFIDLNGLKPVNDNEGHEAGDAMLCHVATLLREHVRAGDMVARIGGDEFGVILDQASEEAARDKADMLMRKIAASKLDLGRTVLPVRISCGLAMVERGDTVLTVLDRADAEMYASRGRPRLL